jgi:excisionase family DNA binding protein
MNVNGMKVDNKTQCEPRLLYPRKDAAYQLGISVRQVDILIANKHLQVRRIGGRVLIPCSELKQFARADHFNIHSRAR